MHLSMELKSFKNVINTYIKFVKQCIFQILRNQNYIIQIFPYMYTLVFVYYRTIIS